MSVEANRDFRDGFGTLIGVGLVVCFVLSVLMHVTVLAVLFAGTRGGSAGGEGGVGGGGGDTVEITVAAPELSETPSPGLPPQPEEAVPEAVEAEERPREQAERTPRARVFHEDPVQLPEESEEPEEVEEPREATETAEAPPAREPEEGPIASGTGAREDSSGRLEGQEGARDLILGSAGLLPGSVSSQRALLPAPRSCDDPVSGVWRAHKYSPLHGDWAQFTLRIEREGPRLHGTITSRMWSGGPFDSSPPPCTIGAHDYTVRMRANGVANGQRITFGAQSYRVVRAHCPSPFFDYNPDRFTGEIDSLSQEFQSVNNDGGRDINAPYVFRRISCDVGE